MRNTSKYLLIQKFVDWYVRWTKRWIEMTNGIMLFKASCKHHHLHSIPDQIQLRLQPIAWLSWSHFFCQHNFQTIDTVVDKRLDGRVACSGYQFAPSCLQLRPHCLYPDSVLTHKYVADCMMKMWFYFRIWIPIDPRVLGPSSSWSFAGMWQTIRLYNFAEEDPRIDSMHGFEPFINSITSILITNLYVIRF